MANINNILLFDTISNPTERLLNNLLSKGFLLAKDSLQQFANSPDFAAEIQVLFPTNADIDDFKARWQTKTAIFPDIEIVSTTDINGANGAYAQQTNKIYLAQEFLLAHQQEIDVIAAVLLEEYGHYLDSELNPVDYPGDEGAIFSALVREEELSNSQLQQLRNENDSAVVIIDGEEVAIEQQTYTFKRIGSGIQPEISSNNSVVWHGQVARQYIDFYDANIATKLEFNSDGIIAENTTFRRAAFDASISGNQVAWIEILDRDNENENGEIFLYNRNTNEIKQITDNNSLKSDVSIDNGYIVFTAYDGSDREIFLYDGNTTKQLTNNDIEDIFPKISGNNIVWQSRDGISLYDIGTDLIEIISEFGSFPDIDGENVVFRVDYTNSDSEIFLYDGDKTRQLTNNNVSDIYPKISGNNVIWLTPGDYGYDISLYNNVSDELLIYDTTFLINPIFGSPIDISGESFVVSSNDNDIYLATLPTNVTFVDRVSRVREGDSTIVRLKREGATDTETTVTVQLSNPFSNLDQPDSSDDAKIYLATFLQAILNGLNKTKILGQGSAPGSILSLLTGIISAEINQNKEIFKNSVADNLDFLNVYPNGSVLNSGNFPIDVTFAPGQTEATLEIETWDDSSVECTHGTFLEIPNQDRSLFVLEDNDEPDVSFWTNEIFKALFSKDNLTLIAAGALGGLVTGGISLKSAVVAAIANTSSSVLMRALACANASEAIDSFAQSLEGILPTTNNNQSTPNFSSSSSLSLTSENNQLFSINNESIEIELPTNFVPTITNNNGDFVVEIDNEGLFLVTDFVSEEQSFSSQQIELDRVADLNDLGQAVGFVLSNEETVATVWDNGVITSIPVNNQSYATAINNSGQITINSVNEDGLAQAYLYESAESNLVPITNFDSTTSTENGAYVVDINNNGDVLGYGLTAEGNLEAFVWKDNSLEFLGTLGGVLSIPTAINDNGDVIGISETSTSEQLTGFIYQDGTISKLDADGDFITLPQAFNENGQVVGIYAPIEGEIDPNTSSAFIWREGELSDLGSLGGSSTIPIDINNQGQIIALSQGTNEQIESVLWDSGNFEVLEDVAVSFDGDGNTINLIDRVDEDTVTNVSLENLFLAEGNEGNIEFAFTVSLDETSNEAITVDYVTEDDTATAEEDYIATNGTLEFTPGETEKTITVEVIGDTEAEEDETFLVELSNVSGGAIANSQGIATIIDDDTETEDKFDVSFYRFRNTQIEDTLGTSTYIYVGEAERDAILSNPDLSGAFELEGQLDGQLFPAFTASTSPDSDLVPIYRYRNTQTETGTYLFATRDDFQQDVDIVQSNFIEEGNGNPAFYAYPAGSAPNSGFADFTRFENVSVADTFIYTAPVESENIRTNLTGSFTDQGEFWAVGI